MKTLLTTTFVALLMVGCGEQAQKEIVEGEGEERAAQAEAKDDPSVPIMIPCEACKRNVSKRSTACPNCGHPTPASVVAYKAAQELARIRAEEERKRQEELARKRAEDAAAAAKKRAEEIERQYGKIIAEAIDWDAKPSGYTGWGKEMYDNGQILLLFQYKDGKKDGLTTAWYKNGQKKWECTYKDGKLVKAAAWKPNGEKCPVTKVVNGNGVAVYYNDDGTESRRHTYKDGELVLD